jgi:hypothetical protein
MNTKSLRGVPCLLLLAATFVAVPAFAASAVGAGTSGATRIVSGTEDFVGPGGAAATGGATRIVSGTEDFVGPGGAVISGAALQIAAPAVRAKALTKS